MSRPPSVVLLDAYHLGDPLFIPQLARDVAARKAGVVLVHGSGEAGERALESLGAIAEARSGAWVTATDEERASVERATRDLNRQLVHEMNEAGAPAVRVMAADRGLVAQSADGAVRAGKVTWLGTLVAQGGVAVVAALVPDASGASALVETDAAAVAAALAHALGAESVSILLTGRVAGIAGPDGVRASVPVAEALAGGTLPDAGLAERLVEASRVPVLATQAASIRSPERPNGTVLTA